MSSVASQKSAVPQRVGFIVAIIAVVTASVLLHIWSGPDDVTAIAGEAEARANVESDDLIITDYEDEQPAALPGMNVFSHLLQRVADVKQHLLLTHVPPDTKHSADDTALSRTALVKDYFALIVMSLLAYGITYAVEAVVLPAGT